MSKSLTSILCRENEWFWADYGCTIGFKEDGMGELKCHYETQIWFIAEIKWKLQRVAHFDGSVDINSIDQSSYNISSSNTNTNTNTKNPTTTPTPTPTHSYPPISQFDIEITLTKTIPPFYKSHVESHGFKINEHVLVEAAFRPKTYTVKLEKGNFPLPAYAAMPVPPKQTQSTFYHDMRFALRLVFDKSPYPPPEEWKNPQWAPDPWQWKVFSGRKSPELEALANRAWWDRCVVS